eukprot:TRINITY_DN18513_c0_g1_i1.p1 TRINITY_DN18513_c0_g1~~TRINITY_DN18513_c0_g1_i1.p1  ORF type:complete len:374 (+),score=115.48 TRINITY_DN18513_c0_g1_i1:80-1123(+)
MDAAERERKDTALMQFLSMTEDRLDIEAAQNLLEAVNWDVQAAVDTLYGGADGAGAGAGAGGGPASGAPRAPPAPTAQPGGDFADAYDDLGGIAAMDVEDQAALGALGGGALRPAGGGPGRGPGGDDAAAAAVAAAQLGLDGGEEDQALAAAIEASYRAQTDAGRFASEDELMAQALRMSQAEEDNRQRQSLREQQEAELAESILMDQVREQEERARVQEAEDRARAERESAQAAERAKQEEEERLNAAVAAKRASLPDEPAAGEAGRLALMLRLPNGQRLQRAFRSSDTVGNVYDFVDTQQEDLARQTYRLVSTMPRQAYEERALSLSEAGIQNQFVLMVEVVSAS